MKKLLYSFFAIYITCTAKAQDAVDIWNLPPLNVEQGRYTTDWDNLSRQYNTPSWWREAKLGAWSHWDPQSMAEDGDWYSRGMYMEGHPQSKFHREHFGHPSEYGYKELCRDWKIDLWDPEDLMRLYQKMGARYFLALGNHHSINQHHHETSNSFHVFPCQKYDSGIENATINRQINWNFAV